MTGPLGTVLIVDDEVDLCESVRFIFDDGGYQTYLAHNVKQAMSVIESEDIDFVVSDIRMPGESGVDLLRKIKARDPEKPRVILVTGYADLTVEEGKKAGAEAMIRKPVKLEELFDTVERLRESKS
ncbi:response regulator [Pseudobacteriovorax antillogorgiicola]|uniref:Response regulator receiver domain-containing protein n=1 Tax=Pseudobacteriovorax antillogorgiicola TaxID=1513793 RepID=A0A1Y6CDR1_9BACT|nr:response regulator [Pseudobacteriovorax antillogorgiicola]TCS51694.1 response regulator receiver domain-containing protein [Pseudobacteriovorax antillogorgiicola]SMF49143.1 Response regulator receiver domain-containing protein [Pseudobacteriovorax antillogorgiicola]